MKPYYQDNYVTIYHGDCREILPQLELETIITDPVWPNAAVKMQGQENPAELFREMCLALPRAERLVVQLGCDSDPFMGSGTTVVASKQLNRKCIGIEIEEKYCDIAANRCRQSVMELNI